MSTIPEVKLKALVNFPASAIGRTGIDVTKSGGTFYLDLDYAQFQITPTVSVGDMPNSYNLIWDEVKQTFAKVPFSLQATSGVSSLGSQTGAIVLDDGLAMNSSTLALTNRVPDYDTATNLAASTTVNSTQNIFRTEGKLAVADRGGATYQQVGSNPAENGSFALTNGRYAKILERYVTPQMFKSSSDAGDDALMLQRFFDYVTTKGGEAVIPYGDYSLSTMSTITAPVDRRIKIRSDGALFRPTGSVVPFTLTGGGYSGGVDLENFTIDQQNNSSATGAWLLKQAGCAHLINPIIRCGGASANYIGIFVGQSNVSNSATGSFWCVIQNPQIFSTTLDTYSVAIMLEGAANASTIRGGNISGADYGGYLSYLATSSYLANHVVFDDVKFEEGVNGVHVKGFAGSVDGSPYGLRVTNCRAESLTTFLNFNAGVNTDTAVPTLLDGNTLIGVTNYISNPGNVRIDARDYPQTLSGTVTFAAATTASITFSPVSQPSSRYVVTLEPTDNKTYWITSKTTAGFTINASSATSATIGWRVTRLS
ncbi:hypothetical protein ACVWZL_003360 [Bradyrhizobium sp. GM2.4]